MAGRITWGILALAMLTSGALASPAAAEACVDPNPSVREEFAEALFVAEATVVEFGPYVNRPYPYKGKTYYEEERKVRFKVHRAFKGKPGREFTIWSSNTSARLSYDVGDRILVFVGSHGPDHHYVTSCGNTGMMSELPAGVLSAVEAEAARK